MGTVLTLKKPLDTLLDLEPLSALTETDADAIAAVALRYGRHTPAAGELFEIKRTDKNGLTLRGDLRLAVNVGAGMEGGRIRAESSVGDGAGARMRGGELRVCGGAGRNACAELQNGFVLIEQNAADGLARCVRRGTIVVGGAAEGEVCAGLRGGTVLLLGGAADESRLARGMCRGTILLPAGTRAPDGFRLAADVDLVFLRLLFLRLRERGVSVPEGWNGGTFTRFVGDAAGLGKGELFVFSEAGV